MVAAAVDLGVVVHAKYRIVSTFLNLIVQATSFQATQDYVFVNTRLL